MAFQKRSMDAIDRLTFGQRHRRPGRDEDSEWLPLDLQVGKIDRSPDIALAIDPATEGGHRFDDQGLYPKIIHALIEVFHDL